MAKVKLDKITRRYGSAVAIENISFTVPDGAFWVLVGPSGCGKSTILRTVAGLEPITSGSLYIADQRMNQVPARQRDVAMVFQNYALYPHMSVRQNLEFGLRMRRVPLSQRAQQVERVAHSLGIGALMERKPGQLSGGQQQRVALGRAIARQPQVFLLDEPLSNLDAQLRDSTRVELKQLHQTFGITTLYVTHDQVEAMTLADQIVVLDRGKIQQIGSPQEIYSVPANAMVAAFIGSPPMNLLSARYHRDHFDIAGQTLPVPTSCQSLGLHPEQIAYVGIRPEHLRLSADDSALQAQVALVEPLGKETLLQLLLPGTGATLMLQSSPQTAPCLGETVQVQIPPEHLFVFADSGERLFP